ncbi:MAG: PIN domain-containing protein [Cyclobacteriaceae bacterium]
MKNVFLDTDILIDFLGDRKPFSKFALSIFVAGYSKTINIYTSSNSITIAYYILAKQVSENKARELVLSLMERLNVIAVSESILKNAFSSEFRDVEDAVQFFSALTVERIDCIVTRNIRDYKKSTLPVLSSEEFHLKNLSQ